MQFHTSIMHAQDFYQHMLLGFLFTSLCAFMFTELSTYGPLLNL